MASVRSKRYAAAAGPAIDKDDSAIADAKGSSVKAIKRGRGGSTKKRKVTRGRVGAPKANPRIGKF